MAENMMCSDQKATNDKYRSEYERIFKFTAKQYFDGLKAWWNDNAPDDMQIGKDK